MSNGVMAALQILVLSVQVRVLVGQQKAPHKQKSVGFFLFSNGTDASRCVESIGKQLWEGKAGD